MGDGRPGRTPPTFVTRIAVFINTCGFVGYAPVAPGTAGSAAGLALYAILRLLGAGPAADAAVIVTLVALGAWSGTLAEEYFGTTDPAPGVIDEVAGMLITLFMVPPGTVTVLAGFVVFRILDVIKPYPAQRLELLPGGLGMMADDCMAAIYSNLVLQAAVWLLPAWLLF